MIYEYNYYIKVDVICRLNQMYLQDSVMKYSMSQLYTLHVLVYVLEEQLFIL